MLAPTVDVGWLSDLTRKEIHDYKCDYQQHPRMVGGDGDLRDDVLPDVFDDLDDIYVHKRWQETRGGSFLFGRSLSRLLQ